jgi:hypothetical protein
MSNRGKGRKFEHEIRHILPKTLAEFSRTVRWHANLKPSVARIWKSRASCNMVAHYGPDFTRGGQCVSGQAKF